jgi:hypothetical protein
MAKQIVQLSYTPRPAQLEIHNAMDSHRFSVIVAHRRLGKTVCVINQLIKYATLCEKDRPRFSYLAPLYSQAKSIAWDYLKHYTAPIPGVKRNESELWVEVPSRSGDMARIRLFGSDSPDSLRGQYNDGVVMDEVAQMKPIIWGEVIMPTLVDRGGWCSFIGTPKGMDLLFKLYNDALKDPDWFAKTYPVTETGVLSVKDLEAARKTMSESQYRQEFLCDFSASSEQMLIPLDLILKATKRTNLPQTYSWAPIVIGVDVARFGDDQSVIYVRQGNHTVAIKKYRDLNLMEFTDYVAAAINHYNATMTFVDVVGIGAGVMDRLVQLGYRNVMGANAGYAADNPRYKNKRAEMWDTMKKWLEEGGDIPDDPLLIAELSSVQYKYDPTDRLILEKKEDMKKRGVSSPDCFVAGTVIATPSGGVEIQDVRAGDDVVTPFGEQKVLKLWVSEAEEVVSRKFGNGSQLVGKPNHKIFTKNGLLRLTKCEEKSTISTLSILNLIKWRYLWQLNLACFKDRSIGFRQLHHITTKTTGLTVCDLRQHYTGIYGNTIPTTKYLKAAVSTILTETPRITLLSINQHISRNGGKTQNTLKKHGSNFYPSTILQSLGIKTPNSNMSGSLLVEKGGTAEKRSLLSSALFAVKNLKHFFLPGHTSVQALAPNGMLVQIVDIGPNQEYANTAEKISLGTSERKTSDSVHTNAPLWQGAHGKEKSVAGPLRQSVKGVGRYFKMGGTTQGNTAVKSATIAQKGKIKTYNLTVDVDNVYYANGVLVSNCADALSLSFFQQVQQNEWDEENNGFYEYRARNADPVTGY